MNINVNENVIEKLTLRLGGKQIELTVEEAKKLHAALNEMFERKVVVEERHVHHDYPYCWMWTYPWSGATYTPTTVPNSTPDPKLPYTVWCSSQNEGTMAVYNASGRRLDISM